MSACGLAFKLWLLTLSIVMERFSEISYAEMQISLETHLESECLTRSTFVRNVNFEEKNNVRSWGQCFKGWLNAFLPC